MDRDEQTGEDEVREKDRGGRMRWRRGGEGRGGEAKSNAATPDGRPLSRCGGEGDGRRGRGRVGNGWGLWLGLGKGRRRGRSYKPRGVIWAGAGSLGCGRSLPTVGRRGGGAGRPLGVAGPGRAEVFLGGPCRAARQAELAAQARPGARAVLGPGPVTSGPCRAWAVPGRPCSGRANGPRAVSSSIL